MRPDRNAVFELDSTISDWDDAYYHPLALPFYDRLIAGMIEAMGVPPGGLVLDAGCGPGVHSIRVAKLGRRVHAVDISSAMLEEARRRVEAAGVAGMVTFDRQDLTRLTFPDRSFEHVFSWGVVIHIKQIDSALHELARIVKPGGTLGLYVTNASALDHRVEALGRWLLRRPLAGLQRYEAGEGIGYAFHGEALWVWRVDARWLVQTMSQRGFRLARRLMGSLTELHTKLAVLKRPLLRLNDLAERVGAPARLAATSLLVFEKAGGRSLPSRPGDGSSGEVGRPDS